MSWKVCHPLSQRYEFCHLAVEPGANISDLCRLFEFSRKTGKRVWLIVADGPILRRPRPIQPSKLASELYFVMMEAGDFSQVRKMALVKK